MTIPDMCVGKQFNAIVTNLVKYLVPISLRLMSHLHSVPVHEAY